MELELDVTESSATETAEKIVALVRERLSTKKDPKLT